MSIARGGVGLQIESASDDYLRLVDSAGQAGEAADPKETDTPSLPQPCEGSTYRVRARQSSGSRSRTIRITAASEEEAKVVASARLDEGWEILTIDPVRI
jgi:hypothetical protein